MNPLLAHQPLYTSMVDRRRNGVQFRLKIIGEPMRPKADLNFYAILDGSMDAPVQ